MQHCPVCQTSISLQAEKCDQCGSNLRIHQFFENMEYRFMNSTTAPTSRPMSMEDAEDYINRKGRKSKIPWLGASQLLVSGLQLIALVYLVSTWDKININQPMDSQTTVSAARELDQNLIKGWHETLTLLKASDEANARLREQIEQLEQKLAGAEVPKPAPAMAPAMAPVAEKAPHVPEKAKE